MGRIGIYGGTFNPPHIGHIYAAQYAVSALELDMLLMMPACISPHKTLPEGSASPQQRMKMLQLATVDMDRMQISDLELLRGGTSYTYETVAQVKALHPADEVVFLMGTDMFLSFDSWRFPEKILESASLGVLYRGDKGEVDAIDAQKQMLQIMKEDWTTEGESVDSILREIKWLEGLKN